MRGNLASTVERMVQFEIIEIVSLCTGATVEIPLEWNGQRSKLLCLGARSKRVAPPQCASSDPSNGEALSISPARQVCAGTVWLMKAV